MNTLKKLLAVAAALCMVVVLAACGSSDADSTPAPGTSDGEQTPDVPAGIAGTYHFDHTDVYGDITSFTVTIKDDGSFNMMTLGAMGSNIYSGAEWTDHGDGTFTTGATDKALDVDWAGPDGSVTWVIDGANVVPDGYEEPTEFLSNDLKDPTNAAEAVGVYTFGQVNSWGSTIPYVVWLNADGTAVIYMDNSFTGVHSYTAEEWTYNGNGTVSIGALSYEGDPPKTENAGPWFADDTYESTWTIRGDGTCVPVNYTDSVMSVDTGSLPEELYYEGIENAGVYVFGQVNSWGSTIPYVVWLNADGTAAIHMDNSFTGVHSYTAEEWTYNGDGTVSIGALSYEGDPPKTENAGPWFADDTYESTWTIYGDGTCMPVNYTDSVMDVDVSALPEEIYPRF